MFVSHYPQTLKYRKFKKDHRTEMSCDLISDLRIFSFFGPYSSSSQIFELSLVAVPPKDLLLLFFNDPIPPTDIGPLPLY